MGTPLVNLMNFLIYLIITAPLMGAGLWIFLKITPYKEFEIIGQGGGDNPARAASSIAAALVLGGKVFALAIVISSAIFHSVSPVDLMIWGMVGIVFQLAIYYIYELTTPFKVADEIPKGNISVGILSAFLSLATGVILAALISY